MRRDQEQREDGGQIRMRAVRNGTMEENLARLSADQKRLLNRLVEAKDSEDRRVKAEIAVTKVLVKQSLDAGIPATLLTQALKLSKPRIYQMHHQALEFLGESA